MSAIESNDENVDNVAVVFQYGAEAFQDAVLVVGNHEFHVNRVFLAARSSYFRTLFNGDFKEKSQKKVEIQTDELAFKRMMDILYFNKIEGDSSFLKCERSDSYEQGGMIKWRPSDEAYAWVDKFWKESLTLMKTCDRFDVSSICLPIIENLLFSNMCTNDSNKCQRCANRMLLALHFDLTGFKKHAKFEVENMVFCFKNFTDYIPNVNIQGTDLPFLLRLLGK